MLGYNTIQTATEGLDGGFGFTSTPCKVFPGLCRGAGGGAAPLVKADNAFCSLSYLLSTARPVDNTVSLPKPYFPNSKIYIDGAFCVFYQTRFYHLSPKALC